MFVHAGMLVFEVVLPNEPKLAEEEVRAAVLAGPDGARAMKRLHSRGEEEAADKLERGKHRRYDSAAAEALLGEEGDAPLGEDGRSTIGEHHAPWLSTACTQATQSLYSQDAQPPGSSCTESQRPKDAPVVPRVIRNTSFLAGLDLAALLLRYDAAGVAANALLLGRCPINLSWPSETPLLSFRARCVHPYRPCAGVPMQPGAGDGQDWAGGQLETARGQEYCALPQPCLKPSASLPLA